MMQPVQKSVVLMKIDLVEFSDRQLMFDDQQNVLHRNVRAHF